MKTSLKINIPESKAYLLIIGILSITLLYFNLYIGSAALFAAFISHLLQPQDYFKEKSSVGRVYRDLIHGYGQNRKADPYRFSTSVMYT
jgi:hypothetical protein